MNICAERPEKAEQNEPVCYLGSGVKHFWGPLFCFSAPFDITQPHTELCFGTHQQLWGFEAQFCILILEALCEMESRYEAHFLSAEDERVRLSPSPSVCLVTQTASCLLSTPIVYYRAKVIFVRVLYCTQACEREISFWGTVRLSHSGTEEGLLPWLFVSFFLLCRMIFFFTYFCAQSPFVVLKNCIKISAHLDKQVDFISLFAKLLFVVRWHAAGQVCGKLQIRFHFTADVPAMFLLCFLKRKELHDHCVLCLCWGNSQSFGMLR